MKLYFDNGKDDKYRLLGDYETEDDAMNAINKFCNERKFKIYYVRHWENDGMRTYDLGSHTEFFKLELAEQMDIKFKNGSYIESLPYNKNVRGKRAELNPLIFDYEKANVESVNEVLKEYFQHQKEEVNINGMR